MKIFKRPAVKSDYSRKLEILKEQNVVVRTLMKDSEDVNKIPKHLHAEFWNRINSIQL
jgi:hypothetical protein